MSARWPATGWRASEGGKDEKLPDGRRHGAGVRGAASAQDLNTGHLAAIDTNGDGTVDSAEFDVFVGGAMTKLDANGDGYVTEVEGDRGDDAGAVRGGQHQRRRRPEPGGADRGMAADFAAADRDGTGTLN